MMSLDRNDKKGAEPLFCSVEGLNVVIGRFVYCLATCVQAHPLSLGAFKMAI